MLERLSVPAFPDPKHVIKLKVIENDINFALLIE
jgi:hypothetical protein